MDGWNTILFYWGKRPIFRSKLAVSFREGGSHREICWAGFNQVVQPDNQVVQPLVVPSAFQGFESEWIHEFIKANVVY